MKTFKDIIKQDIKSTFINDNEFSEKHRIDGKEMSVITDGIELLEREKKVKDKADGLFLKQKLIYVAAEDFGPLPRIGRIIKLDKYDYRIIDAIAENCMYSLTLEAYKG
ncbi:hypothetical protein [Anaerosporobacter faecicola]|uniref:hypothetical protein n=1 Tax=Anaerosporobacter faecicola TaxID=2718714 RepID=UPI00143A163C|nr:hypothetical protein [Anaerosporobacter faecicola]